MSSHSTKVADNDNTVIHTSSNFIKETVLFLLTLAAESEGYL